MVLQSELPEEIIDILSSQTFTVEAGEDTAVTYFDNSITTTNDTDSSPTFTASNNQFIISSKVDFLDGVGDNFNAMIVKMNTKGVSKNLYNEVTTKPNTTQITYQVYCSIFPNL